MRIVYYDLHYALRMLAKRPGFTLVVVLTLSLGIGANTTIFSVVNAIVLSPLPFEDSDRLAMVWQTDPGRGIVDDRVSYRTILDWHERSKLFEDFAAYYNTTHTLTGTDHPERAEGARVSAGFFTALGTKVALGRSLQSEDHQRGAEQVAMISHGLWQRRFGGDPNLIGQVLELDKNPFTIIGVLPRDFRFPLLTPQPEVWTSAVHIPSDLLWSSSRLFRVIGRLAPGATLPRAQVEMEGITDQLRQKRPNLYVDNAGIRLVPLLEEVAGNVRPALLVLQGAVGFVLLIVCANVANLLLVRNSGRAGEFAVRAAVGAGRARLVRQLMTESLLLGFLGGLGGVFAARWGLDAILTVLPDALPRVGEIRMNSRVLSFAVGITLLTSVLFGLTPAFGAARLSLQQALTRRRQSSSYGVKKRLGNGLVASQVALTLALLVAAGLMTRSFQKLMMIEPGFDTENLLTFQLSTELSQDFNPGERVAFYRELADHLGALPGVKAVAAGTRIPLKGWGVVCGPVHIPGRDYPSSSAPPAHQVAVDSGYFQALGIPLLRGRLFSEHEVRGEHGVAIINEYLARRFFPNQDPVGEHIIATNRPTPNTPRLCEIIGVVGNARRNMHYDWEPHVYFPIEQQTWPFMGFGLRTDGDPMLLVPAVRRVLADLTRDEAPFLVATTDQTIADQLAHERFAMYLLGIFAFTALALAAAGIYGVLSYSIEQRTHEIGVRIALGARRGALLGLVLKQGLVPITIGMGIGLILSFAGSRLLSSQLYEIRTTDPATFTGVSLLLAAVALLACYLPARRATKVDPMVALRCE